MLKRLNLETIDKQFPEVKALWQRRCHLDEKNNVLTKAVVSAGAVAGSISLLGSPHLKSNIFHLTCTGNKEEETY